MKTGKNYILAGPIENAREAMRILERQNISYLCDDRYAGKYMMPENIKILSSAELLSRSSEDTIVDIGGGHGDFLRGYGLEILSFRDAIMQYFREEATLYDSLNKRPTFRFQSEQANACLYDKGMAAGTVGSYFWQDLWAAQHIFHHRPDIHYDIGSRVDGFISHLMVFGQRVRLLDIRPLPQALPNIEFVKCDATRMENIQDDSIESLSALCSLEHFGLGRYGDPIDPEACFDCFTAIQKRMKKGGICYISVPIGVEHVEYNAHRVFYAKTIRDSFREMELVEFSAARGALIERNIPLNQYDHYSQHGGGIFGLFMFKK